jgi:hypothetical protein
VSQEKEMYGLSQIAYTVLYGFKFVIIFSDIFVSVGCYISFVNTTCVSAGVLYFVGGQFSGNLITWYNFMLSLS